MQWLNEPSEWAVEGEGFLARFEGLTIQEE
jgi:hypothetical protein